MNEYYFRLQNGEQIYRFHGKIELHIGQKLKIIDKYYKVVDIDNCLVINGNSQMSYPTQTELYCTIEEIK
jgi:hypothetical protein